jgi:hypothetical protein
MYMYKKTHWKCMRTRRNINLKKNTPIQANMYTPGECADGGLGEDSCNTFNVCSESWCAEAQCIKSMSPNTHTHQHHMQFTQTLVRKVNRKSLQHQRRHQGNMQYISADDR